ncbi:MAG: NUDIX hydrolase [Caldilineales bacterium]
MPREYPDYPLPAVAAVILHHDSVLLVQRGREPARGLWGLPGGAVELGETVQTALRREVREECGLEIEIGPLLAVFEPMQQDADGRLRFHYVVLDYLASPRGGELRAGDDAAQVRWLPLTELDAWPVPEETKRVIRQGVSVGTG